MAAELSPGERLLLGHAMVKRRTACAVTIALCVASLCCGGSSPTSPDRTPAVLAPSESFDLPADAPPDALAPPGTTRITVTAVELLALDGTAVSLAAARVNVAYRMRVWIFCPRGLEGLFEYGVSMGSTGTFGTGSSLSPGYNRVQVGVPPYRAPGSYPVDISIERRLLVLDSKRVTVVVN